MQIQPYLVFEGRCEEAVEFYKKALNAEVTMLMRMKDSPEPPSADCAPPPGSDNKILHAEMQIGGNTVMCSDGMMQDKAGFKGFALSISVPDQAAADKYYNALADGGQPFMPLAKTFWSPYFGMVNDRFGVCWMVGIDAK